MVGNLQSELMKARERVAVLEAQAEDLRTLHPASEWHEDNGSVLWHRLDEYGRVCEAPIVGHPLSSDFDWEDWADYTHWSRLPNVDQPIVDTVEGES